MTVTKNRIPALIAISCFFFAFKATAGPLGVRVLDYQPGTGFAREFGTGLGFTNAQVILGQPSRITTGDFAGAVDPFSPPFRRDQLVSLGEGGAITLELDAPIFNNPANPFGLDFIIFGGAGFSITNGDFSGGGLTDGSLFGQNQGRTRISVSQDNETFFGLDESLAPTVDGLFPTDGQGDFTLPVNPALRGNDFAGRDLSGIRSLYAGSGGGGGFDLSWARDLSGNPVAIEGVRFIRIEVLRGRSEVDAVSAVSPASSSLGAGLDEDFSVDPASTGWRVFGDGSLFSWDGEKGSAEVTWDSSRPNSYFYRRLPHVLTKRDDFSIAFDLQLDAIEIGVDPDKPFTFPITVDLLNLAQATRSEFFRGSGINALHGPRGVVEWSYLADSGFGATVGTGLISLDNQWAWANTFPLELVPGPVYHISMSFSAENGILATRMTRDGEAFGPIEDARLSQIFGNPIAGGFSDIGVDAFSISSYSDAGQSPPEFAGSVRARGRLDNVILEIANPLTITSLAREDGQISVTFRTAREGRYWLERTEDLIRWSTVGHLEGVPPGPATIIDRAGAVDQAFYRIRGLRP